MRFSLRNRPKWAGHATHYELRHYKDRCIKYFINLEEELKEMLRKTEEALEEFEGLLDEDTEGYYKGVRDTLKIILGEDKDESNEDK